MRNITDVDKCTGCQACVQLCPQKCISLKTSYDGFLYPMINESDCTMCNLCIQSCPMNSPVKVDNIPRSYAAYNINNEERLLSSSGGIFCLIAELVIENGGLVVGASYDGGFKVIHTIVNNTSDIPRLRGSKYVQSDINGSYAEVENQLISGKQVLFSGTPCQIGGLKSYLKNDYNNLICQDIICHGVPSPKVWDKYLKMRIAQAGSNIIYINLREKSSGWKTYSVSFKFENGKIYKKQFRKDLMMNVFLRNLCLRRSCYQCYYKTLHRQSDITLADYWGIHESMPEMDDDKGTSLVIINSSKGQKLFDEIKEKIVFCQTDINDIGKKHNKAALSSVPCDHRRSEFFSLLDTVSFNSLAHKYCSDNIIVIWKKVLQRVKKLVFLIMNYNNRTRKSTASLKTLKR